MRCLISWIQDPWAVTNGGSLRVRAFAEAMVALGWDVTCSFAGPVAAVAAPDGVERRGTAEAPALAAEPGLLRRLKRELLPVPLSRARKGHEELRAEVWDLCLTTELWLLPTLPPAGRLWVDHSDLLSRLARTAARQRRFPASSTARLQALELERREARAARQADVVTTAGWSDHATLASRVPVPVTWLPTPVDQKPVARLASPPQLTVGFLADFAHGPNRDALEVLRTWLDDGFAHDARVVVAGHGSDRLPGLPPGVEALGPVASPDDFYAQVDVVLCPVRSGGGMKVKAVEALMAARPVVVHDHVLEGLPTGLRTALTRYEAGMRAEEVQAPPTIAHDALRPFQSSSFQATVLRLLAEHGSASG